jgi:hypothetical protein
MDREPVSSRQEWAPLSTQLSATVHKIVRRDRDRAMARLTALSTGQSDTLSTAWYFSRCLMSSHTCGTVKVISSCISCQCRNIAFVAHHTSTGGTGLSYPHAHDKTQFTSVLVRQTFCADPVGGRRPAKGWMNDGGGQLGGQLAGLSSVRSREDQRPGRADA